ncbi:MAG: hypothetical protein V3V13_07415 [Paracoccaceae bacterium]
MQNFKNIFGYWISVFDKESAETSARMAGLPVLILGINAGVFACINILGATSTKPTAIASMLISIILIIFAFRIRSARYASLPYLSALFLLFTIYNMGNDVYFYLYTSGFQLETVAIIIGWIVPVFASALSISGLRGWHWLKHNNIRMLF